MAQLKTKPGSSSRPKAKAAKKSTKREARASANPQASSLFPIVGIGASAGGLEALQKFFAHMPADTGMAFVVVTHQQPGRESLLAELLGRSTTMKVAEAFDGVKLEPNHVYVAPPSSNLALLNGALHRMDTEKTDIPPLPIDYFFRSLAEDQRKRSIGIVLSGMGTDGALGLAAIKGVSGLTIVQDPSSALYAGMPSSAIATHSADYSLIPSEIPKRLITYTKEPYFLGKIIAPESPAITEESLQKIFVLLRSCTGHDFSGYKRNTLRRRIERQMNLHQIPETSQYVHYLQENSKEVEILFKELLISVTNFFRDPEAWRALSASLTELIKSRPKNYTIRTWVPACATGEEVYSLAITLRECIDKAKSHLDAQVFGTDLDMEAVDAARSGLYPEGIAADISAKRLDRYFTREDDAYRVRKGIREMAIFAPQNVTKDPPFTRLDLISCRNLLIYLNSDLQNKLLPIFHYALKPGGLLFLGPSETIGALTELFEPVDKRWKIFRRKESPLGSRALPEIPTQPLTGDEGNSPAAAFAPTPSRQPPISDQVERLLLARLTPTSVVVSENGDIVYIHGRSGEYLEPTEGKPKSNILKMAREGLKIELASALRKCSAKEGEIVSDNVRLKINGNFAHIRLSVSKIVEPDSLSGLFLVTFLPIPPSNSESFREHESKLQRKSVKRERLEQLEQELQYLKESHQTTLEELETSNEELKSTNEELQSTNEELQSTNEELETSKEEMQSLNEELITVNAELQSNVVDLSQASDDMQNLLNSTEIATVFLDNELNIKRFTDQAKGIVSIRQNDIGRPLSDLASNLECEDLMADCRAVLSNLDLWEREVKTRTGVWYLMRILPYRTANNAIDGLVLTFVGVSKLKEAESKLASTNANLENMLESMSRLQEVGTRFSRNSTNPKRFLKMVLSCATKIAGADRGNIQLVDLESGNLTIQAFKGFEKPWLEFWDSETKRGSGTYCTALRKKKRVVVKDVRVDPMFVGTPALDIQLQAGVLAVVSIPLTTYDGKLTGVMSVHFNQPHEPDDRTLHVLELLARQAAEFLTPHSK